MFRNKAWTGLLSAVILWSAAAGLTQSAGEFGQLACQILENGYLNGETIRLDGAIRMAPR